MRNGRENDLQFQGVTLAGDEGDKEKERSIN